MRRITLGKPHFERVPLEPISSLRLFHATGHGYAMHLHYHPEIELTLILQGHGIRFVGDSISSFAPGDLCLVPGNLLHTWYTGQEPQQTDAIVVQIHPDVLITAAGHWPEFRRLQSLPDCCNRGVQISGHAAEAISRHLAHAADAPESSAARLTSVLLAFDAACDRACHHPLSTTPAAPPQANPALTRFSRILDALHTQMPHPPDQAVMADIADMSPAAFSRFFKRLVGRSYVDYINAWRIGLACRQLVQTDLPITRIAFDCGFENLSNFNRRFRHYKQTTPRDYRAAATIRGQ